MTKSPIAVRVMVDTNVYDAAVHNSELGSLIRALQGIGRIAVSTTRIQHEELQEIPPERDVGQASAVQTEQLPVGVFVLDYGILNDDHLGSEKADALFDRMRTESASNIEDAMIAATAATHADILVTDDRRFRKRFAGLSTATKAMSTSEFHTFLLTLT